MEENKLDKLKTYVDHNKVEMDIHEPPVMDWSGVANKTVLAKGKVVRLSSVVRWAAAAIIVLIGGNVAFWIYSSKNQSDNYPVTNENISVELFQVSDEIAEIEFYYSSQIKDALKIVEGLGHADELNVQLDILDSEYNNLKKELNNNLDNEVVIYQMIENYRLKLELLENAIRIISSDDQIVKNNEIQDYEKYTVYY